VHDGAETLVYRIHLTSARAPVTEVG
jgi:hypothetical protein